MDKCTFDGQNLNPCKQMKLLLETQGAGTNHFEMPTHVMMSDITNEFNAGITYRYGRKKNSILYISFCPLCGSKIKPAFL